MKIQEALDTASKRAREVKEQHVRKTKSGDTDILTIIEVYRGDVPVAHIMHPPHRDYMLACASLAAGAFSADVLAVTMETFASTSLTNPVTGRDWEPGEMSKVAAEHDGLAKGWVDEALMTTVLNRAGDEASTRQRYRIEGRTVTWLEDLGLMSSEGIVPRSLRKAMDNPTSGSIAARLGLTPASVKMDPVVMSAISDAAAVEAIQGVGAHVPDAPPFVMIGTIADKPGSLRHQTLRKYLPKSQIEF